MSEIENNREVHTPKYFWKPDIIDSSPGSLIKTKRVWINNVLGL